MKLAEIARFTDDVAAVTEFYTRLLNVAPLARSDDMAIFIVDGVKIFIHKTYTPGAGDLPPEDHLAFAVPDVDATCQELSARGLAVERPPQDYYWGRSAYLRAPDGQLIEITQ
jgi:catechol 2,3-dioxygenase-like lactoylglutathione lyase family enzyme